MKKFLIPIILVLCVSAAMAAAVREMPIAEGVSIRITLVNQNPDPVEPGSIVDVRFKVENIGSREGENVTLELLLEYPFSIYSGKAVRNIGDVYGRQIGDKGVIVKYKLKVDENAVAGENDLQLRYSVKKGTWIELEDFQIDVRPQDAILAVVGVETEDKISPGSLADVKINLKNMADFFIKDIKIKLDLDNKPFVPIGSTNEQIIDIMKAQEDAVVEFNLMAEPDAESGAYKIHLELDYLDKLGTRYLRNHTIGLIIGDEPDLLIDIDTSTIYSVRKAGEISVKFVNRGLSDIKLLNVKLNPSRDYVIISTDQVYVGNIDSDDYETADFTLYVNRASGDGKVILPLTLEYKDSNNNEYEQIYNLELKIYSSWQANRMGINGGSGSAATVITIILVVLGLWLYKKKKWPFTLLKRFRKKEE